MNKAIFLDRDGTINVDKGYVHEKKDFEFIPGAIEGMRKLQDAGFLLIIITNQSGIGRGYYSENDYLELMEWMNRELEKQGVRISASCFCPHIPDAPVIRYKKECNCRKPKTEMYIKAVSDFNIDVGWSWIIGDRLRDLGLCGIERCKGFLIENTESPSVIEDVKKGRFTNVMYADNLYSAASYIINGKMR